MMFGGRGEWSRMRGWDEQTFLSLLRFCLAKSEASRRCGRPRQNFRRSRILNEAGLPATKRGRCSALASPARGSTSLFVLVQAIALYFIRRSSIWIPRLVIRASIDLTLGSLAIRAIGRHLENPDLLRCHAATTSCFIFEHAASTPWSLMTRTHVRRIARLASR